MIRKKRKGSSPISSVAKRQQTEGSKNSFESEQALFQFLSNVSPLTYVDRLQISSDGKKLVTLVYVSGNWYDEAKVSTLVNLTERFPECKLILSGGVGRLTLPEIKKIGGEPIYLRDRLVEEGVNPLRIIVCNASIVTTHNVNFLIYYLQQCCDMERWPEKELKAEFQIFVVDESFLLRRLKATIANVLKQAIENKSILPYNMVRRINFVSAGNKSYGEMVDGHHAGYSVAAWLLLGEWKRLHEYSRAGGLELFTKEQAFGGLSVDKNLMKQIKELEKRYEEELQSFRSLAPEKLLEITAPVSSKDILRNRPGN